MDRDNFVNSIKGHEQGIGSGREGGVGFREFPFFLHRGVVSWGLKACRRTVYLIVVVFFLYTHICACVYIIY